MYLTIRDYTHDTAAKDAFTSVLNAKTSNQVHKNIFIDNEKQDAMIFYLCL